MKILDFEFEDPENILDELMNLSDEDLLLFKRKYHISRNKLLEAIFYPQTARD